MVYSFNFNMKVCLISKMFDVYFQQDFNVDVNNVLVFQIVDVCILLIILKYCQMIVSLGFKFGFVLVILCKLFYLQVFVDVKFLNIKVEGFGIVLVEVG